MALSMRFVSRAAIVAAVLGLAAAFALSMSAGPATATHGDKGDKKGDKNKAFVVQNCRKKLVHKPRHMDLDCRGRRIRHRRGYEEAKSLSWNRFNKSRARGKGRVVFRNRAETGRRFESQRAKVRLLRLRRCGRRNLKVYRTAKITFRGSPPEGYSKQHRIRNLRCGSRRK